MTSIHRSAASGYAVGAEGYAANRPDYPSALGAWLRDELALGSASHVVDLGAGTGKFLPTLIAIGARIVAVEPVAAMRATLHARFPEIDARAGTATAIPCDDGAIDAVCCAQSFHWFANADALADIHRVLKPGGSLVLVWNERDESVAWVAAISTLLREVEGDTPRYRSKAWKQVFPTSGFSALKQTVFANPHVGPAEQVIVGRTLSASFVAALPPAQRDRLAQRVRDIVAAAPELSGDIVSFPYSTRVYVCRKT